MANGLTKILLIQTPSDTGDLLTGPAFEVERVERLSAGLEKLASQTFDLLLLDLSLPESNGLDTFTKMRAAASHLPVVILSSADPDDWAARLLRSGAQDFLLKETLTEAALRQSIRFAIERHRSRRAEIRDSYLLKALMDNIPDSIYFKDTQSRFLSINRALAKKFGLADPAQAMGKTDADFFKEAHARQALEDERRVIETGAPLVGFEEVETWADGSTTWASTTKMSLRDQAGRIVGTFGMSRDITERKQAEQALAEQTRALQEKNRQVQEELKMARELQLAMLPHKFPCVPRNKLPRESALEFFSFYFPTGVVSGDFFDVMALSDTAVGVFVCDVMGHDVRAALVTAMMRALVEDLSLAAAEPGKLLAQINRGLTGVFKQTGATMYATAFYVIADIVEGKLRYSNAGHPDPFQLHRANGEVERLNALAGQKKGPALGLFEEAEFPSYERAMAAGDLIMLYTDGLIEVENASQEQFSQDRLAAAVGRRAVMPAKQLLGEVLSEIRKFSGQPDFADDVCLVGIEVKWLANGSELAQF